MRAMLSAFGVTLSNTARNAAEALQRVASNSYEIIVCDYFLGDGADGQQLLEHLRENKLISLGTAFMMVTAERSYEKVVAAAEFAPDDYLVKPFSAETMRLRLEKVLEKKEALGGICELLEKGRFGEAVAACDRLLAERTKYTVDVVRLKADACLASQRLDDARQVYDKVLAMRPVPWARMGLAREIGRAHV